MRTSIHPSRARCLSSRLERAWTREVSRQDTTRQRQHMADMLLGEGLSGRLAIWPLPRPFPFLDVRSAPFAISNSPARPSICILHIVIGG